MNCTAGAPGSAPLRVLFVNRYYAPDISATSQMLTDLAQALARAGMQVAVICGDQLYESPAARLPVREQRRGVSVHRLPSTRFGRQRLSGRALDYLTFYVAATRTLLRLARNCDVMVMKTDPPLMSLIGWLVAARRGVVCVNWLQDVFPEVASRLGLSPLPRPLEALLRVLRDRSLAAADANVVLGARMQQYLVARGIPAARLCVGENWADEAAVAALPPSQSALRRRLGLTDRFVVGSSGNLGRAHDADTLLAAAQALRADPATVFLMIGGGANMRQLEARARASKLTQVRFLPYQPQAALADSLAAGDVHLVTLLPQLEGLIVPSKLYGILAAGRPKGFVGDPGGEVAHVLRASGAGLTMAGADAPGLVTALCALRDDPAERERMGRRARALFEERYTLRAAVERWERLLTRLAASPERSGAAPPAAFRQTG
ncbi:MAG: glycosyltransferase family 4 protein [Steroidobacteraceae bacterium]